MVKMAKPSRSYHRIMAETDGRGHDGDNWNSFAERKSKMTARASASKTIWNFKNAPLVHLARRQPVESTIERL